MSPSKTRLIIVAGAAAVALQGCVVGPDYKKPEASVPASFRGMEGADAAASIADLPWWEVYRDPTLQELIRAAVQNNYDLRIAIARIEQARALAAQAKSQFYPTVGYGASASSGRNEYLGSMAYNGGETNSPVGAVLNAAWELDVWGRVRRLNEAALAEYLATEEARRGVMLSLVSGVAQAYFELLELDLELDIARRTTESFAESLRIFTLRLDGGTASKLETSRAEAAMASTAANIPEIERRIMFKENQINVLLGRAPGPVARDVKLTDDLVPPEVPAGIPASLLERRPDILEAEQALRSANAQIGVAVANFYPQIGLTAFLGKVSPEVSALTAGTTNAWSIAASATGPIFTAGLLDAQLQQARAVWQQVALRYDQTVLNAMEEVSNALAAREKLRGVREERERSVRAYEESVAVAMQRYIAGKSSYYEVLDAQQQLFPQENLLAVTRLEQLSAVVALYKALGGGWSLTTDDWGPTTPPPPAPGTTEKASGGPPADGEKQARGE